MHSIKNILGHGMFLQTRGLFAGPKCIHPEGKDKEPEGCRWSQNCPRRPSTESEARMEERRVGLRARLVKTGKIRDQSVWRPPDWRECPGSSTRLPDFGGPRERAPWSVLRRVVPHDF